MSRSIAEKSADAYHHGDLRSALLRAAWDLLGEKGVDGLSLRAAARRAGVSYQAPYHHFADKAGLLQTMAEEGFAQLAEALLRSQAGAAGNRDPLQRLGEAYVKFALDNPARFRLMHRPERLGAAHAPPAGERARNILLDELRVGQEAGRVVAGDLESLTLTCWALVHGLASLLVDGLPMPAARRRKAMQAATGHLIQGIARR